jgi:cold shock CspA family protein
VLALCAHICVRRPGRKSGGGRPPDSVVSRTFRVPRTGTLRTWHEDRGFGFIAPVDGGRELFVHISAFPRDGSRPTAGEMLSFEVGAGKDGKLQALHVRRLALGNPPTYPRSRRPTRTTKRSFVPTLISGLLVVALGAYGYSTYQSASKRRALQASTPEPAANPSGKLGTFRCDGRIHCSQMTSCAEAKFFLSNCPGTRMDGNNDGAPCEQQWCTGPFAK